MRMNTFTNLNERFNQRVLSMILLGVQPPYNDSEEELLKTTMATERALNSRLGKFREADLAKAFAEFADGAAFGVVNDWRKYSNFVMSAELPIDSIVSAVVKELRRDHWTTRSGPYFSIGNTENETFDFPEVLDLNTRRFIPGTWWITPEECAITLDASVIRNGNHYIRDDFQVIEKVHPLVNDPKGKIYRVSDVSTWCNLVDTYGIHASVSTYDWAPKTAHRPMVPDWNRVASDWDAVYVSVSAYMETAYWPISLSGNDWTVLSGWHPGSTVWFHSQ